MYEISKLMLFNVVTVQAAGGVFEAVEMGLIPEFAVRVWVKERF